MGRTKGIPAKAPKQSRKRFRWHPGTVALREIRSLQKSTKFVLPRLPFVRLVREISDRWSNDLRWKFVALTALQEAAEDYCAEIFRDTNFLAIEGSKKIEIKPRHMRLALILRGERPKSFICAPYPKKTKKEKN